MYSISLFCLYGVHLMCKVVNLLVSHKSLRLSSLFHIFVGFLVLKFLMKSIQAVWIFKLVTSFVMSLLYFKILILFFSFPFLFGLILHFLSLHFHFGYAQFFWYYIVVILVVIIVEHLFNMVIFNSFGG